MHATPNDWERERRSLLDQRISELGLSVQGSLVEKYVGRLYAELTASGMAAGSYALNDYDDVWGAVRHFFTAESKAVES